MLFERDTLRLRLSNALRQLKKGSSSATDGATSPTRDLTDKSFKYSLTLSTKNVGFFPDNFGVARFKRDTEKVSIGRASTRIAAAQALLQPEPQVGAQATELNIRKPKTDEQRVTFRPGGMPEPSQLPRWTRPFVPPEPRPYVNLGARPRTRFPFRNPRPQGLYENSQQVRRPQQEKPENPSAARPTPHIQTLQPPPKFVLNAIPFKTPIQEALNIMGIFRPKLIQAHVWETILPGYNVAFVAGNRSGKTLGLFSLVLIYEVDTFSKFCAWKVESLGRVGFYESDSERNNKILFFQRKMKNLKNIGSFKFMTSNPENVSANYALRRSVVFKNFITRWVSTQSSWSLRKVMSMSKHVK